MVALQAEEAKLSERCLHAGQGYSTSPESHSAPGVLCCPLALGFGAALHDSAPCSGCRRNSSAAGSGACAHRRVTGADRTAALFELMAAGRGVRKQHFFFFFKLKHNLVEPPRVRAVAVVAAVVVAAVVVIACR